ncbi:MAG: glutamate-5-semialdehyde dehydrogenase [Lachnospiraceae bacterium]|nr:glutamate-5-semialdehyde dehydrogenase [Lachnospiraceae bacterium]
MELLEICKQAKEVKQQIGMLSASQKNQALLAAADKLLADGKKLMDANAVDMENGRKNHMPEGLLDRLLLNEGRIAQMAEGLRQIAALDDPIGEVLSMKKRPNELMIGKKRVPLGVIGIIYESRPNVTADAFGLCFKTGNAVILRGGRDAIYSNQAITDCIREALQEQNLPQEAISLITDTSHETAREFMHMNQYVDVLIPRGGAGLIRTVVENATIPVIETGTGNCHIYVDESADFLMACEIILNAKTQRIGVCNACESLLVHEKIVDAFIPVLEKRLAEKHVEIRADQNIQKASIPEANVVLAEEADWGTEYLDYKLSAKTVSSVEEAIAHINRYNTGHSDAIITKDYANAQKFLNEVDAAAVYVNASTRFTDGFEFGFGAEIGISTQKLHARGPMGLEALTSTKYIIYGNGQIRP